LHVSVKLLDAGLDPETAVALRVTELPAVTGLGVAVPVAVGGVEELVTVTEILKFPLRPSASLTVQGKAYVFAAVGAGTEYAAAYVLPVVFGRLKDELPPIAVRLQLTIMPVDAGAVPGTMFEVKIVELPAATGLGLLDPLPEGAPVPNGVNEKSSTARPSSAPETSTSVQRIQKVAPLAMLSVIVELSAVRSAASFPFLAPAVPARSGV